LKASTNWAASGKLLETKTKKEGAISQLTAHKEEYTSNQGDLYVAFEQGKNNWRLDFSVRFGQKPWERTIRAGGLACIK